MLLSFFQSSTALADSTMMTKSSLEPLKWTLVCGSFPRILVVFGGLVSVMWLFWEEIELQWSFRVMIAVEVGQCDGRRGQMKSTRPLLKLELA